MISATCLASLLFRPVRDNLQETLPGVTAPEMNTSRNVLERISVTSLVARAPTFLRTMQGGVRVPDMNFHKCKRVFMIDCCR